MIVVMKEQLYYLLKKGMYLEEPVSVLDYASLYPSSMIASNISHESIVKVEEFDDTHTLDEVEEINLKNINKGIEFRRCENISKNKSNIDKDKLIEEIKSYNKYPLLDSIWLKSLIIDFLKKCKKTFNL